MPTINVGYKEIASFCQHLSYFFTVWYFCNKYLDSALEANIDVIIHYKNILKYNWDEFN